MKKISKISGSLALFALALFAWSCDSESDPTAPMPTLSVVEDDIEINQAFEDLDNITLEILRENGLGARTLDGSICDEAIIDFDESAQIITVDFGTGCTSNGITRKGKLIISYTEDILSPGATIVTTFESYEVNGLKIEGTRTIRNSGIDILRFTLTLTVEIRNGVITWPDGSSATLTSDQTRELVLGSSGYEAFISGTASGTGREGFNYSTNTSVPLVITQDCVETGIWTPNSGILNFDYEGIEVTVDYGSGECDKTITITYPGGVEERVLD